MQDNVSRSALSVSRVYSTLSNHACNQKQNLFDYSNVLKLSQRGLKWGQRGTKLSHSFVYRATM